MQVIVIVLSSLVMLIASLPYSVLAQARAPDPAAAVRVVNLNTASAEELERLPGIGPTRARAILELRTKLKRFTRLEDLLRVRGIGRATFRRLRPLLTLEGPTTLTQFRSGCRDPPGSHECRRLGLQAPGSRLQASVRTSCDR